MQHVTVTSSAAASAKSCPGRLVSTLIAEHHSNTRALDLDNRTICQGRANSKCAYQLKLLVVVPGLLACYPKQVLTCCRGSMPAG